MNRNLLTRHLLAYGFYLLVAVGFTFPLILKFSTAFPGAPESDAYEYARHIWWFTHALKNGEPLFFHPLLAYPDGLPAWWLWAIPLQSFPAWLFALIMPLPAAYNLMTLLRLALNGWAMYFLIRRLLDDTHTDSPLTTNPDAPALLAGLVFALYPTIQGQMFGSHVGIITVWGAPLYIDTLLCLRKNTTYHIRRRILPYIRAGLFFTATILGSNLLLIVVLFPITLFFVLARFLERDWQWLRRIIIAVFIGVIFASVFMIPALIEQLNATSAVNPGGEVRFSADLLAIVSPSIFHPLFSHLNYPARVLGTNIVEGTGYIGIVAGLLAIIAITRTKAARFWLWLALFAWAMSLGPILKIFDLPATLTVDGQLTYIPMPFALLSNLPVINITRTPARFNLTVALAIAVMVGYGMAWLWARIRLRWLFLVVAMTAITFEYQGYWSNWRPEFPTISAEIPAEIRNLANDDAVRAVLNLPYDNLLVAKEAMYLQTGHQHPIIGGFISRQTPVSPAKLSILQHTLDFALLDATGVDVIILFREWDETLNNTVYTKLGTPFYENNRIAAFHVPEPDAVPQVTVREQQTCSTYPCNQSIYTPEPAWMLFTADLQTIGSRTLDVQVDGETIHTLTVNESAELSVPVLIDAGYHTLSLALNPPCPDHPAPSRLICHTIDAENVMLSAPMPPIFDAPSIFENAITLDNAYLSNTGDVWLSWDFAQGVDESLIRFVQVIDANGEQITGFDAPVGEFAAGSQYNETVMLNLPDDLPSGSYAVYVGWYRYPGIQRLDVLSAVEGSVNDWVLVGEIRYP